MRPIAINQGALRGARAELESACADLRAALEEVDHPREEFPWRDLLVAGVRGLVDDAGQVARRCGSIAGAIDDSVLDFDQLDVMVGRAAEVAARLDRVAP